MEFDSSYTLLCDSQSQFASLVEQTGAAEARHLRSLAKDASLRKRLHDQLLDNDNNDELAVDGGENDPLILQNYSV